MANFKLMPALAEGVDPYQYEIEVGTATFTTTSTSATFRTRLGNVVGGFVNLTGDATIPTDSSVAYNIPLGAVSNGAITVSRSSQAAISGSVVCVLLVGTKTAVG
jgi:hypothetical protein